MLRPLLIAAALTFSTCAATAAERQLGAHQHGHGTLNMVLEGNTLSVELEAPGADIAGFEHEAKSAEDKAAVSKATATLKQPDAVFRLPQAAQCTLKEVKAGLEDEDHDEPKEKSGDSHEHEAGHSAFHAEYVLDCKAPSELKSVTFSYFATFKMAQGLTIGVITPKGQSTFEATRDKPMIELSGLM